MLCRSQLGQKLKKLLAGLIKPVSGDEDLGGKERILYILLFLSIFVFSLINLIRLVDILSNPNDRGLDLIYTLLILALFFFIFWLARQGRFYTAAWTLIIIYSAPMFYSLITWGADLPAAIILGVLIITLIGALIGPRWLIWSTAGLSLFMLGLTYLQSSGLMPVADYWRSERHELTDALVYALLFMIIAAVAHMFCQALDKALRRARRSEQELRQERDWLEQKVAQRSEELRQAQADQINQLYRLAEFGRLSSGVFHDLINPLSAISLNLEQVKEARSDQLAQNRGYLNQATLAAKKMEGLITGIKKQIQTDNSLSLFSLNKEIREVVEILAYKARQHNLNFDLDLPTEISLYGCPIKFSQIIMNLVSNAIEASADFNNIDHRPKATPGQQMPHELAKNINQPDANLQPCTTIKIGLHRHGQEAVISVKDRGRGIDPSHFNKIFTPFFSTKQKHHRPGLGGLGLGLSSSKHITEKYFHGHIRVKSAPNQGSKFIITLPLTQAPDASD